VAILLEAIQEALLDQGAEMPLTSLRMEKRSVDLELMDSDRDQWAQGIEVAKK
jgi:hypothetical protein